MRDFGEGKIDILVSTSVVEVGVDVPNATIMMIEGADRFGLAQLHQFRGRIGRGEHQSYCFLFTTAEKETGRRLKAVVQAKNGLELAEKDLEIRGPGDLFGTRQAGIPDLVLKNLTDQKLVRDARQEAILLLQNDPTLKKYAALLNKLEEMEKTVHLE
jgi:ATP-dependent DNA helicase RecG